jgi:hypothetical protein
MSDNQEWVTVDKKLLENLEECADFLRILLFNGVKDWSGYKNSFKQMEEFKKLKEGKNG